MNHCAQCKHATKRSSSRGLMGGIAYVVIDEIRLTCSKHGELKPKTCNNFTKK